MTFERYEHPDPSGYSHGWTVLAFEGGRQIGGYIGPCSFSGGRLRAYRDGLPAQSSAFDSEDECRAYMAGDKLP